MSKYELLKQHLENRAASEVPVTFDDVETIIGAKLPRSAKLYRMWWSNNASNHVHAQSWLDAGYRTERVDMDAKTLVFVRGDSRPARGMAEPHHEFKSTEKKPRRHPLFGRLKGMVTIEPGYDLAQPAMPEWAELIDEKYGPETRK
jgi:hypothetical protein